MNRQRLRQSAGVVVALAGLVVAALSARMGNLGLSALGGLAVLVGTTVYVGISRYGERLYRFRGSVVDFTTASAFVYGLVHVIALATFFAVLSFLAASTGLVAPSTADGGTTDAVLPFFVGVLPGVVLGAGYPVVVQRLDVLSRLSVAEIAFGTDNILTIGTYVLLLVGYEPVSAVSYAVAYVVSRVASLATIYGYARLRASSS